ncbi:hypothetical protein E2C01_040405 [Portunus trituberculatus]|uniref:Uncharacterized protein n=1 Tax=Portunus trituberculatus TaxID=210409 RepID=A0A5B7FGE0_PORTR|nr:hypothetical protein [Portunus trituberculatus]
MISLLNISRLIVTCFHLNISTHYFPYFFKGHFYFSYFIKGYNCFSSVTHHLPPADFSCLLDVLDRNPQGLNSDCREALRKRQEMYSAAIKFFNFRFCSRTHIVTLKHNLKKKTLQHYGWIKVLSSDILRCFDVLHL